MPTSLFTRHSLVQQTAYSDLKRRAQEPRRLLVGTPGSVGEREVKGRRFHYRQFYDAIGKKGATYLGPVGDAEAERRTDDIREDIKAANGFLREARELSRAGFVRADGRSVAVLVAAANHGLFRAGATLVGSHAYGVLLNELGVKAAAYATEDLDIARAKPLSLPPDTTFAGILADSTVPLHPVPGFDRNEPTTSYKVTGADRFRVDLLVPTSAREVTIAAVPELGAHGAALPHLAFLLESPMGAIVLGRDAVVPVQVPRPEAFAWHKLLVARLRGPSRDKARKDLTQAAVLLAVLVEDAPDALEHAFGELPRGTKGKVREAGRVVIAELAASAHAGAAEVVRGILSG